MPNRPSPTPRGRAALLGGVAIWFTLICGCGRKPAPAVSFFAAPRQGHVFLAQLVAEHPLCEQYRRLEQEIAALRAPCSAPAISPVPLELGEMFLPAPDLPSFPLEQFEHRRQAWELTLLPERDSYTTQLAPDLAAELEWTRHRLQRQGQRRIDEFTAHEQACVAELRAAAVRARQEALNNAGLDPKLTDAAAEETARKERQRLLDEIEAETNAARAEAEERIAQERAGIEAETQAEIEQAEAAVGERMQERLQVFVKNGSETRARMSNAITPPSPLGAAESVSWQPTTVPPSAAFQPTLRPLLEADRRTRMAQAARLAAARAELGAALFEATALAVQRIAGLHDWRVYLPPQEPATGQDMTERVRPELRRMFHPQPS